MLFSVSLNRYFQVGLYGAFALVSAEDGTPEIRDNDVGPIRTDTSISLFGAALEKIRQKRRSSLTASPTAEIDQEIELYMSEVKAADGVMEDQFAFWSKRVQKFPCLYKIAIDVLAIPATSAPAERVFSRASYILERNRHHLSDKKLEDELFCKVNVDFLEIGN